MILAHQNMPEISVNYFCVENNYFIVTLCNSNELTVVDCIEFQILLVIQLVGMKSFICIYRSYLLMRTG